MCKPNATITAASRPFLYDFTVTRGSEPVPYRAFLHECCRYPLTGERIAALEAVEPEKSGAREVDRGPDGERGSSVPQER